MNKLSTGVDVLPLKMIVYRKKLFSITLWCIFILFCTYARKNRSKVSPATIDKYFIFNFFFSKLFVFIEPNISNQLHLHINFCLFSKQICFSLLSTAICFNKFINCIRNTYIYIPLAPPFAMVV